MEIFNDIFIHGSIDNLNKFINNMLNNLKEGWKRGDKEREDDLNKQAFGGRYFCIEIDKKSSLPPSVIILFFSDKDKEIRVSNIFIHNNDNSSFDELNKILNIFDDIYVKPYKKEFALQVTRTTGNIEEQLTPPMYDLLIKFSKNANKSLAVSHPLDRERWNNFIINSFEKDELLNSMALAEWLFNKEGWKENIANDLATQYEYSISLLKQYRNSKS